MRWRIPLVGAGVALAGYGLFRLAAQPGSSQPQSLIVWLIGGVVLHDGIIAPITIGTGWLLARWIRPRERRFVQFALVWSGLVAVIAIPLIALRGSQPVGKALEEQNYGAHLAVLVGGIAAVVALAYVMIAVRRRCGQRRNAMNSRAAIDQDSTSS
jgi:hypothetical protein